MSLRGVRLAMLGAVLALGAALIWAAPNAHAVGETISVTQTPSTGAGLVAQSNITTGAVSRGTLNVEVDDSRVYQTIDAGFGASFTDSSAYVLANLKAANLSAYNSLMNKIFAKTASDGVGLTFWRLPMTSSDFTAAANPWTGRDSSGSAFALTSQDTGRIIPVIQDALAINPNLRIVASPWSAPGWMKSNGSMICNTGSGDSTLSPAQNTAWANYFVSWIQAYQANGIPIWGVTPQNEPAYCPTNYPGMTWTAASEAAWVSTYLEPALNTAGFGSKPILGFDHNWAFQAFPLDQYNATGAGSFDGMAFHCYDNTSDPAIMSKVHNRNPAKSIFETECSSDTQPTDIIKFSTPEMAALSVQNWAQGAITWNLALDQNSGPHLGGCTTCAGLITIDSGTHAVTLRNNYYQLGQLSRFVTVGATHIGSTTDAHGIVTAAFKNPSGQEVLVATNRTGASITFRVTWNNQGSFNYTLASRATVTFTGTVAASASLPNTPANNRVFKILSRTTGKPFGVSGASTANGAGIVQWTEDGDLDQRWTLKDAGGGWFNVINGNSGLGLDNGGTSTDGVAMQQWAVVGVGNNNQQWQFTSTGTGYYTIRNRTSNKLLDLRDGSISDDAVIQQWAAVSGNPNQEWKLVPVS